MTSASQADSAGSIPVTRSPMDPGHSLGCCCWVSPAGLFDPDLTLKILVRCGHAHVLVLVTIHRAGPLPLVHSCPRGRMNDERVHDGSRARQAARGVYGDAWHRCVSDDLAWMLRSGVLLDEAFTLVTELTGERPAPVDGDRVWVPGHTDDELIADMRTRWPARRPSREACAPPAGSGLRAHAGFLSPGTGPPRTCGGPRDLTGLG